MIKDHPHLHIVIKMTKTNLARGIDVIDGKLGGDARHAGRREKCLHMIKILKMPITPKVEKCHKDSKDWRDWKNTI